MTRKLTESEVDRSGTAQQIETLTRMLKESEVDRTARHEQIETLTGMLKDRKYAEGRVVEWPLCLPARGFVRHIKSHVGLKYSN